MNQEKSGPSKNAGAYDLRHPGLIMKDGNGAVHEFMGIWPLKPDADLVEFTDTLAFSDFWDPPTLSFSKATTLLGLIRTARWFVGTSTEFGPTLYFISQFDSSLEKYFDDFVLNGKKNLENIWGSSSAADFSPQFEPLPTHNYSSSNSSRSRRSACPIASRSLSVVRSSARSSGPRVSAGMRSRTNACTSAVG